MSKREGSPSSNANSFGILAIKKSKGDVVENESMELDQTEQNIPVAGPSGMNPGPSNTNPRQLYSPRPSLYCFKPDRPRSRSVDDERVNPSAVTFHHPKTHRSRAESRRILLSTLETDPSQLNRNEDVAPNQTGQPLRATDSMESMEVDEISVKKVESSSSVEREEKSNRLDWTGSRI